MSSPGRVTPRSKLARRIYSQGLSSLRNEVSDLQINQPPRARSTPKAPSSADTPRSNCRRNALLSIADRCQDWLCGRHAGPRTRSLIRAFLALCNPLFPRETSRSVGYARPSSGKCVLDRYRGITQKGNAWDDVKGNSPIGPLNDVLVLANSHHQGMGELDRSHPVSTSV